MLTRIQRIQLIQIALNGAPAEEAGVLSEVAAQTCAATAAHYKKAGFSPPWVGYLAISDSDIIGTCAFTAAPAAGRVEIAYHTFPGFEGRGAATAMAAELIALACGVQPGMEIFAQTLPEKNASNAILRKLGFRFFSAIDHPEEGQVWEWRLTSSI